MIPLLEALAEVDDVRKYIPQFVTVDNKIDFQRASSVLVDWRQGDSKSKEVKEDF